MLSGLLKDEKKIASLIVQAPEKVIVEQKEMGAGFMASSEEILAAIKTGDKKALVDALKSFMELCYQEHEMMEGESEGEEKSLIEE